jgi:MOSC domain-containing protein YiiM
MGKVAAVCISEVKGEAKREVPEVELVENHGVLGDAHAGAWHRQVSLLSLQKIEDFRAKGAKAANGAFGENIIVDGIDLASLRPGTKFFCGEALLELTQIGKECHKRCSIFDAMGDCIMPREGVFAVVITGGVIKKGDEIQIRE